MTLQFEFLSMLRIPTRNYTHLRRVEFRHLNEKKWETKEK